MVDVEQVLQSYREFKLRKFSQEEILKRICNRHKVRMWDIKELFKEIEYCETEWKKRQRSDLYE